jgi:hypothetical protein
MITLKAICIAMGIYFIALQIREDLKKRGRK